MNQAGLIFMFFIGLFAVLQPVQAQDAGWRDLVKLADEHLANHRFEDAAQLYLEAFDNRRNRVQYLAAAAEAYAAGRMYADALPLFEQLMDFPRQPMAGFRHAQMLKHLEQYPEALEAFRSFRLGYDMRAKNSDEVFDRVQREIRGINIAMESRNLLPDYKVVSLSDEINTEYQEIAPEFYDGWLYYTSTQTGSYAIFRSQLSGRQWTKPIRPVMFRALGDRHFAGGSFEQEGKRFYFSVCDEHPGKNPATCALYVLEEQGGLWSEPVRLPDQINAEGSIQAHPQVVRVRDRDFLIFSSNRPGGQGGMDIWYTSKPAGANPLAFARPVNAGTPVNTQGDEVTPHYNHDEQVLYFSSNYHAGFGGYDVFSARGEPQTWRGVQNLGKPVNSGADDWYYTTRTGPFKAMWSSNKKIHIDDSGVHENIFALQHAGSLIPLSISGHVHLLGRPADTIPRASLALHALDLTGQRVLIRSTVSDDGNFSFNLLPEMKYQLTATAYGYYNQTIDISTEGVQRETHVRRSIELEPQPGFVAVTLPEETESEPDPKTTLPSEPELEPIVTMTDEDAGIPVMEQKPEVTAADAVSEPTVEADTIQTELVNDIYILDNAKEVPEPPMTGVAEISSPQHDSPQSEKIPSEEPVEPDLSVLQEPEAPVLEQPVVVETPVYKIQLAAVLQYKESEFAGALPLGNLELETAPNGLTRVLLGNYESEPETRQVLRALEQLGFEGGFVVRYVGGERTVLPNP